VESDHCGVQEAKVTDVVVPRPKAGSPDGDGKPRGLEVVGGTLFADLVWAHHVWERGRSEGKAQPEQKAEYERALAAFLEAEGEITHVYWSTQGASAVAMTELRKRERSLLWEADDVIRLHRVTDWVARDTVGVADLLHECDALAIRVGEILRGPSERIAMRWILCVQEHLLGLFERAGGGAPDRAAAKELVQRERDELGRIEQYYSRAAGQAGRIVYFMGMLIGVVGVAALAAIPLLPLWYFDVFGSEYEVDVGIVYLCVAAGAVGALVSVMYRLRPGGSFSLDVEVGRPLIRRLGLFRPFVGATFGLLVYAMLASGILLVEANADQKALYFAVAAFFAGFSERWVHVVIQDAEDRIAGATPAAAAEPGTT
jgi:hypothetical protein